MIRFFQSKSNIGDKFRKMNLYVVYIIVYCSLEALGCPLIQ